MTGPADPMVPVEVNGQVRLFSGELTQAQLQELLADLRVRGNRDTLFTESPDAILTWP